MTGCEGVGVVPQQVLHRLLELVAGHAGGQLGDRHQQGRVADDAADTIDDLGQGGHRAEVVAAHGLGDGLVEPLSRLGVEVVGEQPAQLGEGDPGVPDREVPLGGETVHRLLVAASSRHGDLAALSHRQPVGPPGHDEARREALDVPLPRPRAGLVEVVDVEEQVAFRGGEHAEVRQVGVAAQLRVEAGVGVGGEVGGHHRRASAEEGEG